MASIFKPKGKTRYTIVSVDELGRRRKKVGATDKTVTHNSRQSPPKAAPEQDLRRAPSEAEDEDAAPVTAGASHTPPPARCASAARDRYAPLTAGTLEPVPWDDRPPPERRALLDRLYAAVDRDLNCLFESIGVRLAGGKGS